jgi:hypothetical protein
VINLDDYLTLKQEWLLFPLLLPAVVPYFLVIGIPPRTVGEIIGEWWTDRRIVWGKE